MDVAWIDLAPIGVDLHASSVAWKCNWGIVDDLSLSCKVVDASLLANFCESPIEVDRWLRNFFLVLHIVKNMVIRSMLKPLVVERALKVLMFYLSCKVRLHASIFQGPILASFGFWLGLKVWGAFQNPLVPDCYLMLILKDLAALVLGSLFAKVQDIGVWKIP